MHLYKTCRQVLSGHETNDSQMDSVVTWLSVTYGWLTCVSYRISTLYILPKTGSVNTSMKSFSLSEFVMERKTLNFGCLLLWAYHVYNVYRRYKYNTITLYVWKRDLH